MREALDGGDVLTGIALHGWPLFLHLHVDHAVVVLALEANPAPGVGVGDGAQKLLQNSKAKGQTVHANPAVFEHYYDG